MALRISTFTLSIGLLLALCRPAVVRAGDEDVKEPPKKVEEKVPEDTPLPKEPETPPPVVEETKPDEPETVTEEKKTEEPAEPEPTPEEPKKVAKEPKGGDDDDEPDDLVEIPAQNVPPPVPRKPYVWHDLDWNVDYSRLVDSVETADPGRGVLAPALGFRGYRPNMIAASYGDRTPGYGGLIEYSWNRIGAGVFFSYRHTNGEDPLIASYGLGGLYGLYRWLPWDMSPYFLTGVEIGSQTDEGLGGMLGLGVETRLYSSWTLLLGWTFHSTVHRGFLGGALGWSF